MGRPLAIAWACVGALAVVGSGWLVWLAFVASRCDCLVR